MKTSSALISSMLIILISTSAMAEQASSPAVHKKVQEALDWTLPENTCEAPKPPGKSKEVRDDNGVTRTEWDVDGYTLARYERKEKRWQKCVDKYKAKLSREMDTLKNSAQYGLTQEQAHTILGNMKMIQDVLLTPDGQLPDQAAQ